MGLSDFRAWALGEQKAINATGDLVVGRCSAKITDAELDEMGPYERARTLKSIRDHKANAKRMMYREKDPAKVAEYRRYEAIHRQREREKRLGQVVTPSPKHQLAAAWRDDVRKFLDGCGEHVFMRDVLRAFGCTNRTRSPGVEVQAIGMLMRENGWEPVRRQKDGRVFWAWGKVGCGPKQTELTPTLAEVIRACSGSQKEIAKALNVPRRIVSEVLADRTWGGNRKGFMGVAASEIDAEIGYA